jgi:hypothetical protein
LKGSEKMESSRGRGLPKVGPEVMLELLRLIEEESRTYANYDQARQGFLTVIGQARNLLIKVNENSADSIQVKRQYFGRKIYEVVRGFIERYPILKYIIDEGINIEECLSENKLWKSTGISETGRRALEKAEMENFQARCELEKAEVVQFLEEFRVSDENKRLWLEGLEAEMFTLQNPIAYKTLVLRGGLLESGRLTDEIIKKFDSLNELIMLNKRRNDRRATLEIVESTRNLTTLEMEYFREIWELEDAMGMKSYLGTVPISSTRKDLTKENQEEMIQRVEIMRNQIQQKWASRITLAVKIISEQDRANSVRVAANEDDLKIIRKIVLGGYMDLSKEICLKISTTADQDMASILNQSVQDESGEIYTPLANNNLYGVMLALEKNFKNAPITMMFLSVQELFQEQIDQEPSKVLEWVNGKAAVWAAFGYFDLFTPDVLFTFLMIFKMRQGNVRSKCLNVVLERMRDSPDEFTPEVMRKRNQWH